MTGEYGRWPETNSINDSVNWRQAERITAGVDIGTTGTQAVILSDGVLLGFANVRTGTDFKAAAERAIALAAGSSGLRKEDIAAVGAVGFGRKNVTFATKELDDVRCVAKGARFLFGPAVMTVVDLGGQSTKAVSLYDWDRVRTFKVNDKCATGMGRHIEIMAELLQVPITEIGTLSLMPETDPEPVSTTCYNFAYPETIGLFRQGYKEDAYGENDVLAAYLFTVAWRILGTIGKLAPLDIGDIKLDREIAFTGGLAKNEGITKRLERELGMTALKSDYDPQIAGAVGAALLA
jgi:predicted CoA-substrate-specific enzyme activase